MSTARNTTCQALVLKSKLTGEGDLMVTLLTQEQGKITVVAKGTRKLTSSRRAHLESGNVVTVFLVNTKGLPILTQTKLLADSGSCRQQLGLLRRLIEYLEIIDAVTVEEELEPGLFAQILQVREMVIGGMSRRQIQTQLAQILTLLGISEEHHQNPATLSLSALVSEFTGKKLLAFDYLQS